MGRLPDNSLFCLHGTPAIHYTLSSTTLNEKSGFTRSSLMYRQRYIVSPLPTNILIVSRFGSKRLLNALNVNVNGYLLVSCQWRNTGGSRGQTAVSPTPPCPQT